MKKIAVIGLGHVGLATAAFWAQHHDVTGYERDETRCAQIRRIPKDAPHTTLGAAYLKCQSRLTLKTSIEDELGQHDFIMIATPTDYDPQSGVLYVDEISGIIELCRQRSKDAVIIIKSTLPMGYVQQMREKCASNRIIYVPEFMRETAAFEDVCAPSRIIIGDTGPVGDMVKRLHEDAYGFFDQTHPQANFPIHLCDPDEAEAIKLFSNAYLATRIAFFNDLDSFALSRGLKSETIIKGICDDPRIGDYYNNPSFGFGGYCLPKDTRALEASFPSPAQAMISSVITANERRKDAIVAAIKALTPECVGIYRLTMEQNATSMRDSIMLEFVQRLKAAGLNLIIYEPLWAESHFEGIEIQNNLAAFKNQSQLVIANRHSPDLEDIADKVFSRDIQHLKH